MRSPPSGREETKYVRAKCRQAFSGQSLVEGYATPVSLCDTVTGLDDDNTARLLIANRHAAGKRPENSSYRMPR
jgi:hypothetical protein